jgi:tetratricopeptide (TPR) repeat protein
LSSARIEELRKKFDENPRRYFAPLANEYRKAGDFDQAIFICQEYLPQQPGHMSGHIVFGQALFEARRLPEAKTVFETALSLDPENLIALRHLADISRDLGDTTAAKGWYERVLQADPRNEEVLDSVDKRDSGRPTPATPAPAVAAAAKTAEAPAAAAQSKTVPDAASAPTVELSAAQVQEMLKARQATKQPERTTEPELIEPMTLDTTPTVEIRAEDTAAMEGLEPTSHQGGLDLPTIEPLGLETNAAPGIHAEPVADAPAPLDGLDTIPLEISLPSAPAAPAPEPATMEIPAPTGPDDLLDLGSFGLPSAPPAPAPPAAETPIDGGHDAGLIDLDFPSPSPAASEPAVADSAATVVMDAVKSVVPAVQEAVESAAPALLDFVETALPPVVDAVKSTVEAVVETPTMIMEAITSPAPKPEPVDAPAAGAAAPRTSQSVPFVTETMAQLYLSQGHRAEAIDIYRKLIEARPNDRELQSRLAAIERQMSPVTEPAPSAAAPIESAPSARRFAGTGPSIRNVLRELFGFDGSTAYATGGGAQASLPAEVGSIDMLFSASPVAGALSPLAMAFDGGYVATQGSVDALFSGGAS